MLPFASLAIECRMLNWPGSVAALAPRLHPSAVLVDLHHARVVVAVGDEDVAVAIPRDVGRTIERAPTAAAAACPARLGAAASTASARRPSTMRHFPPATELDDHVRAFVGRPDVAVLVDAHRVSERETVEILADLANERAVGPELEELRAPPAPCTVLRAPVRLKT